jgi:phosphoserine phosphatase
MPSVSKKQHNFMAAVANNPKFAKKAGVSSAVGKEFLTADKGKTFKQGGTMKPTDMKKNPGMAKLPKAVRNKMGFMKEGGAAHSDVKKDMPMMKKVAAKAVKGHEKKLHGMAKGGLAAGHKAADGVATKGKTKGKMVKMNRGGAC